LDYSSIVLYPRVLADRSEDLLDLVSKRMPIFRSDGIRLYYEEQGSGAPVVLLHGFTTSLDGNWRRRGWIDLLAAHGFRTAALDFPSHGRSDRVYDADRCTTEQLARDVVALLDHLDMPTASIVGFSMGAGVAFQVALDRPDRVAKLVAGGIGDPALNRLHDPREIGELITAFEAESADQVIAPNAKRIRRNADLAGNQPEALLPYLRHGGWPGGLADTRPTDTPVLLIVAKRDEYMAGTDALRAWLPPAATAVEAEGRTHHDVLDDESVKQAVVAFLAA
jgi:non-heme chloroperoxidase